MDNERLEAIKRRMGDKRLETFTQSEMQFLFSEIQRLQAVVDAARVWNSARKEYLDVLATIRGGLPITEVDDLAEGWYQEAEQVLVAKLAAYEGMEVSGE